MNKIKSQDVVWVFIFYEKISPKIHRRLKALGFNRSGYKYYIQVFNKRRPRLNCVIKELKSFAHSGNSNSGKLDILRVTDQQFGQMISVYCVK